jgi:hypothetical protein
MAAFEGVLRPHGISTTFLNISSEMDVLWEAATHNPANFALSLPNATRTKRILKIVPHSTVIPRMFPNVDAPDNTMIWYQRQVVELPTADPTIWLRTVEQKWTPTRTLTIPPGILNVDKVLAIINAATGPNEVWTFDASVSTFVITVTPTDPPIVFGYFVDGAHVPPPVSYANMTYILEPPLTHLFNVLGMERVASEKSLLPLSLTLDQTNSATFDNLLGSNLEQRNAYPLFQRELHNYNSWATLVFVSPQNNAPNFAGPILVHVTITDLGDSSTVDAETGLVQDIVTTVNLADSPFGTFKERLAHDSEVEAIEYAQARNISNFRVRLTDTRNRQLTLPRNFPIFLRLQMVHSAD